MTRITENTIEAFAIELLDKLDYEYIDTPDFAPDSQNPEMESFEQVLLLCRLQKAVRRMNHSIPADTQVEAINSTQARQKSTRQMTIADDIKLTVTQDRQGTPAYNTGLAKVAVQCSASKFVVKIAQLLKASKRWKSIIYCMTILIIACNQASSDNKENEGTKDKTAELKENKFNSTQTIQDKEAPKTEEEIVLDIKKKYGDINNNINSYKKIKKDLMGESTEGGELEGYFNNGELKKIVCSYYGEMGKLIEEYYFWDNDIFFSFTQDYLYNMPMYMDGSKVEKIYENRYYFQDDKLIRWLDPNKEKVAKSKIAKKETEILQNANKLKEKAN